MAQYRLSASIASRGAGRSVVAMAAYRAGDRLLDERYGLAHDYTRRSGVEHSELILPDDAPAWAEDREQLWNRVEQHEKRQNAQLGREVQISLPHELGAEQRKELAVEFAQHVADEYGFAVDLAIHAPSERGDDRNHHAHLLLTSRAFDAGRESGWAKTKDRRFDAIAMERAGDENAVEDIREAWETMQNAALARADIRDEQGELVQVSRLSYVRQGLDIEPTQHEGPDATAIKRRGGDSDRAADNDEIRQRNADEAEREELTQQIEESRAVIEEELSEVHRTPDEDKLKHALHDLDPVQAIFADLDTAARPAHQGAGRFSAMRYTVSEVDTFNRELTQEDEPEYEPASAFHQWLAAPDPQRRASGEPGLQRERLSSDPLEADPPTASDAPAAHPWRWRGLDGLNAELAEPVEEEQKKAREGSGDRQFANITERVDTDPKPEDFERMPPLEPERSGYGRSR